MTEEVTPQSESVGYKNPPPSTRFKKGQSGNPRGRPKDRKRMLPYDHVLGQMVTIREDGRQKRVTAAEAFLLQLTKKGLEGDGPSMRAFLTAMESAKPRRSGGDDKLEILRIFFTAFGPGIALRELDMAVKKHATDKDRSRWELRSWIVEAALARFKEKTLTSEQQKEVWGATYRPHTVSWPEWWSYHGS